MKPLTRETIFKSKYIHCSKQLKEQTFKPIKHHCLTIFKLKERLYFKVISLNNVHANIKKQGSRAKQECELQHGYPIKRLKFGLGRSIKNLSLGQKHVNLSVMRYFRLHSDFIWC